MARYSRDQIRDIKNRLALTAVAAAVGGGVFLFGPGLENVVANAREHRAEPWAPERMVQVAQVMSWTFREERAIEIYEEFYLAYSGDEELVDFGEVTEYEVNSYFIPAIARRYDEEHPRPKRVGEKAHPLLGKVLAAYAMHWERRRRYDISDHIWLCLERLWPPGSPEQQFGADGIRRSMLRSF